MSQQQAVVVTGAAKGIGRATALRLAHAGFRVYAGVRSAVDGARLAQEAGGRNIVPLLLDVTDQVSISRAAEFVTADLSDAALRGLVNNAGIAVAGPLEFLPVSELRRQLEVNVIGQVAAAQAFLPLLRKSHGRIVFMGSIAGRSALPLMGPYSASKFALEAIADALRVELMPAGVDVVLIEPGVIATPIWQTSIHAADQLLAALPPEVDRYYGRVIRAVRERAGGGEVNGLPPDRVARVVEKALTKSHPRTRYLVGRDARVRLWLQRIPDRIRDRMIARRLARL